LGLREDISADGLGTTMDAALGQALDLSLDPLDVVRERSRHRLDLAASERAVQLLDLLESGHVGNTKPSLPLWAKCEGLEVNPVGMTHPSP